MIQFREKKEPNPILDFYKVQDWVDGVILTVWAIVIIGGGSFFVWTAFAGVNTADIIVATWIIKAAVGFSAAIDILLIYAVFSKSPKLRANRSKHILQLILFSGVLVGLVSKIFDF